MNDFNNSTQSLKQLMGNTDLQFILDQTYRILGNPLLVHDMDYNVIAYTQNIITDDPIWNEFEHDGFVGPDRIEFYKKECFFTLAANAKRITFLKSSKLKYDRIFAKIFNGEGIQVGCVCMPECCRAFDKTDPIMFEQVCDIIDKALAQDNHYTIYGQKYQEALINRLILSQIKSKEEYSAHVESLYMNLRSYLYLAVIGTSYSDYKPDNIRDELKKMNPHHKYSILDGNVVAIISSDKARLELETDLGELNNLLIRHNLSMGISKCFDNLYSLSTHYAIALEDLEKKLYLPTCSIL